MAYIYCFSYGLSDCRIIATAPHVTGKQEVEQSTCNRGTGSRTKYM